MCVSAVVGLLTKTDSELGGSPGARSPVGSRDSTLTTALNFKALYLSEKRVAAEQQKRISELDSRLERSRAEVEALTKREAQQLQESARLQEMIVSIKCEFANVNEKYDSLAHDRDVLRDECAALKLRLLKKERSQDTAAESKSSRFSKWTSSKRKASTTLDGSSACDGDSMVLLD